MFLCSSCANKRGLKRNKCGDVRRWQCGQCKKITAVRMYYGINPEPPPRDLNSMT